MSDGHRTSTIPRPPGSRDPSGPSERAVADRDDTRLVRRKRPRNLLALGGVAITLAVAAALFVLPFKAWLQQRSLLEESSSELAALQAANDRLAAENENLQTSEGVEAAARDDLGYQQANEEAVAALPPPAVPGVLPAGWPYDDVTQILTVRTVKRLRDAEASLVTTTIAPPAAAPTESSLAGSGSPP